MADKHLYDKEGNYMGRISDTPPSSSSSSSSEKMTFGLILIFGLVGAVPGLIIGTIVGPAVFIGGDHGSAGAAGAENDGAAIGAIIFGIAGLLFGWWIKKSE